MGDLERKIQSLAEDGKRGFKGNRYHNMHYKIHSFAWMTQKHHIYYCVDNYVCFTA